MRPENQIDHVQNLLLYQIFSIEDVNNSHFEIGKKTGFKLALQNLKILKYPYTAVELTSTLKIISYYIDDQQYEFQADQNEQLRYNSVKRYPAIRNLNAKNFQIYCNFLSGLFTGCLEYLGCDCYIEFNKYGDEVVFVIYLA